MAGGAETSIAIANYLTGALCMISDNHYSRLTTGAIGKVKYYFRKIFKT